MHFRKFHFHIEDLDETSIKRHLANIDAGSIGLSCHSLPAAAKTRSAVCNPVPDF
jgi:hypothetical protein